MNLQKTCAVCYGSMDFFTPVNIRIATKKLTHKRKGRKAATNREKKYHNKKKISMQKSYFAHILQTKNITDLKFRYEYK